MYTQTTTEEYVDPFEAAFQKQDEMEKEKESSKNSGGGNYEFEEIHWCSLDANKKVPFRIIGIPMEVRKKESDPKLVLQSKILKDDKKSYVKINWRHIEERGKYIPDPDWILTRLYEKVMESDWVKFTEADVDGKEILKGEDGKITNRKGHNGKYRKKYYEHECFKRIENNKTASDKVEKKFYPSSRVVMNVIPRIENEWNIENKHTSILSTKVGFKDLDNGDRILFPETGISLSLYSEILNHVKNYLKNWNTDLIVKRYETNDKWENLIEDAGMGERLSADVRNKVSAKDLTDEEKVYGLFDIDKLFPECSYYKLKKSLEGLFKLVDLELGTKFYDELCTLVDEEKKHWEANKSSETSEDKPAQESGKKPVEKPSENDIERDVKEEKKAEQAEQSERKQRSVENNVNKVLASTFPKFSEMKDEADIKDLLDSFEKVTKEGIVWKANISLVPCDKCKTMLPNTVLQCPNCGEKFN